MKKKKSASPSKDQNKEQYELPNSFTVQHGDYELEETMTAGKRRARNKNVLVLDTYYNKNLITQSQYDAGLKMYTTWIRAGVSERIIISYEKVRFGNIENLSEKNIIARQTMNEAFNYLGVDLGKCIFSVCCMNEYAKDWALNRNLKSRTGLDILRLGLNSLCELWKILPK